MLNCVREIVTMLFEVCFKNMLTYVWKHVEVFWSVFSMKTCSSVSEKMIKCFGNYVKVFSKTMCFRKQVEVFSKNMLQCF